MGWLVCVDGFVEAWGDEDAGVCLDHGAELKRGCSKADAVS